MLAMAIWPSEGKRAEIDLIIEIISLLNTIDGDGNSASISQGTLTPLPGWEVRGLCRLDELRLVKHVLN